MNKNCARCNKVVYPIEELKCLDKTWHKTCFRCHECGMTLNMKTYKGFNKLPYCEAHIPKAKATIVADTPELKRIAENTKHQSNVKYHADFEKAKGKFTQVADDPETLRIKANTKIISNVAYHGDLEKKAAMEKQRAEAEVAENRDQESEYFSETLAAEQLSQYAPHSPTQGGGTTTILQTSTHNQHQITQQQPQQQQQHLQQQHQIQQQQSYANNKTLQQHHSPTQMHHHNTLAQINKSQQQNNSQHNYATSAVGNNQSQQLQQQQQYQQQQQQQHQHQTQAPQLKQQKQPSPTYQHPPAPQQHKNQSQQSHQIQSANYAAQNYQQQQQQQQQQQAQQLQQQNQHGQNNYNNLRQTIVQSSHHPAGGNYEQQYDSYGRPINNPGQNIAATNVYNNNSNQYGYNTTVAYQQQHQQQQLQQQQQQQQQANTLGYNAYAMTYGNGTTGVMGNNTTSNGGGGGYFGGINVMGSGSNNGSGIGKIADYDPLTDGPRNIPSAPRQSATLIYSSDNNRGSVNNSVYPKRVGSVSDIDPANGVYGSLTDHNNQYYAQHQQTQQLHQQQQQHIHGHQQHKTNSRVYRAVYDYQAQDTDEVSFCEGDLIFEIKPTESGWMTGKIERTGHTGMLPANYVEPAVI